MENKNDDLNSENKDVNIENSVNNAGVELKKDNKSLVNVDKKNFHTKKKNKDLTVTIILCIIFFLIIGSVTAYFLINKKFKQEKENPQQIIKSSMEVMSGIKSYAFKGDMSVNVSSEGNLPDGGDPMNFSMAMKFDGQSDQTDLNNIKSSFNVNPKINVSTMGGNENISFDFSMMSFGKISEQIIYYKLNDFDLGAMGLIYGKMIVPYKGKWYFMNMKELQEMNGASMEENNFDFEKMMELYRKYEMIKFKNNLGDTEINGQEVYHYQVGIDSGIVLDFYINIFKVMSSEFMFSPDEDFEDFESELKENRKEIIAVLDEIMTNVKTEIWIGKEDRAIHKMAMRGEFDEKFIEKLEEKMEKEKYPESYYPNYEEKNINNNSAGKLSFDLIMTMSNFNQPVNISKPEGAEDLMKTMEEMFGGFTGGMIPGAYNGFDSDGDGLSDEMEEMYGTDKNNPDTDGDGHKDGEEIKNGYDPTIPGDARLDYEKLFSAQ